MTSFKLKDINSFHGSIASRDKSRVTTKFLLIKNVAVRPKFRFNIDNY